MIELKRGLARIAQSDESTGALGRHSLLLATLVVLLVALPIVNIVFGGDLRFSILLALVLVAAAYVNSPHRWSFIATSTIAVAAVVGLAAAAITGSIATRIVADSLSLALLGFTTLLMLNSLVHSKRVSADTIVGGICVYLLVGLCFTVMFGLLCDVAPGSIVEGAVEIRRGGSELTPQAAKLLYFSFVTLTTLGYGDITPQSEIAQMMAVAEAVIGQLYLAIFVARLVALYVAGDRHHPLGRNSSSEN